MRKSTGHQGLSSLGITICEAQDSPKEHQKLQVLGNGLVK